MNRFIFLFFLSILFAFLASSLLIIFADSSLSKIPILPNEKEEAYMERNPTSEEKVKEDRGYSESILKRNLFKAKLNIEIPKRRSEREIEEEALMEILKDMTLKGIVIGKNMKSFAVIDRGSRGVWTYGLGEEVERGLTVGQIGMNEVILKKGDLTFTLKLFAKSFERKEGVKPSSEKGTEKPLVRIPENVIRREGEKIIIDKGFAEKAKNDTVLVNAIAASVAVKASLDERGNPHGLKIVSIDKGSPVERIGIMPNDIVMEVNGFKVTSMEEANKAYEVLKDAKKFEVKILRNGKPRTIYYEIR